MIFYDTTNQPIPLRQLNYTVALESIEPVTVQNGGVQGEHRATRIQFSLDSAFVSWCRSLLENGRLFCRADACDGSGVVHRSLTLEITQEILASGQIYYDLDQAITRQGGFVKLCLIFSLLSNENSTWTTAKSYYATLELEASPTYKEEDFHDMTGLYQQTKVYSEQAAAGASLAEASASAAAQSAKATAEQAALCDEARLHCSSQADSAALHSSKADNYAALAKESAETAAASEKTATKASENASEAAADIKDSFEAVIITSAEVAPSVTVENNHEYRYAAPLTALTLALPTELTAEDKLSALLTFKTVANTDMVLSYSTANIDFTNDDCEEGVFIPLQNKMYDIAIYWNGLKYQGIVRGVAL